MTWTLRLLAVLSLCGATGCGGFDIGPAIGHEFPKAAKSLTAPPADLVRPEAP